MNVLQKNIINTSNKLCRLQIKRCALYMNYRYNSSSFHLNQKEPQMSNILNLNRNSTKKKLPKLKKTRRDTRDQTSRDNVLQKEISEAIVAFNVKNERKLQNADIINTSELIDLFWFTKSRPQVVVPNVEIIYQTSEGEGIGIINKDLYMSNYFPHELESKYGVVKVPKAIVGDIVTVTLLRHQQTHIESSLVKVQNSTSRKTKRKDLLVVCNDFDECSGCQLQMLKYEDQLQFKKGVIQKAYQFFFPEIFKSIDMSDIGNVINSPLQYSYRTKITPHYSWKSTDTPETVNIGFNNINPTKPTKDIRSCPIASQSINKELPNTRQRVRQELASKIPEMTKSNQSTVVLRDSIKVDFQTGEYENVCITQPKKIVTEKVGDFVFQFPANEFFQNNNSILPYVLDYIRYHLSFDSIDYKNIIDTYCGSGFFSISLSNDIPQYGKVFGIELSKKSIDYAIHNAKLNGLETPKKIQFIEGTAETIFTNSEFKNSNISGSDSVVIMDPSRKGSNETFLTQLLEFKPKLIVYVSCNVFTQARDISTLMSLQNNRQDSVKYKVRDISGFDFFPQTKHVETVAILELQ